MKKIFLVLLIFLVTVSASFALSDNLTVEDAISDDLNLTNDTNIDNISKDVKKELVGVRNDTLLYKDYLNGFEGFVANLDDVEYVMYCEDYPMADMKVVKYNQSENFKDFDMLVFKYKSSSYAIHTNPERINLNGIGEVPAYIEGDSIYVGHPKNDDNVRFEGYIVDLGIHESLVRDGNSNNQTAAGDDNTTSLLDDQSPVLNQNDTGNVAENSSEVSKHDPVLETGGPVVALLVCLLVSIVGFRRKD